MAGPAVWRGFFEQPLKKPLNLRLLFQNFLLKEPLGFNRDYFKTSVLKAMLCLASNLEKLWFCRP
jgi:hypothetical protein